MGMLSSKLRSIATGPNTKGISHWCPGCEEMHAITIESGPESSRPTWHWDGNIDAPTVSPSVRITGKQTIKLNGEWTGEWVRDAAGNAVDMCCHYILTAGQLNFCSDSTHALAGKTVPLPDLPDAFRD
jgi:hypothetical protein